MVDYPQSKSSMTVRELQAILAECDPDAIVSLYVPSLIDSNDVEVMEDSDLADQSYAFAPAVQSGYQTGGDVAYHDVFDENHQVKPGVKPNCVSIYIDAHDLERMVRSRKNSIERKSIGADDKEEYLSSDPNSVIVDVCLSRDTYTSLRQVLKHYNSSHQVKIEQACTHGILTIPKVLEMFAEDLEMTQSRPGCWEASNIYQVMASHGYNL